MARVKDTVKVLEAYFGESLENSEYEDEQRKYLYEPLLKIEAQRDRAIELLKETLNPWRDDSLWKEKFQVLMKELK